MNKQLINTLLNSSAFKNLLRFFLVLMVVLPVGYGLLVHSLTSQSFKDRAASEIDALLTQIGVGGTPINIGTTSWGGLFHPLTLTLSDMSLTPSNDDQDATLPKFNYEMRHLKIGVGFIDLLQGRLKIKSLGVKKLRIYSAETSPTSSSTGAPLGELTFYLDYGDPDFECIIEKCHINPKNLMGIHQVIPSFLQGVDLPLNLQGKLMYRDGNLADGYLTLKTDRGMLKCPPYYPTQMMIRDMTSHVTVKENLFIIEDLSFVHVIDPFAPSFEDTPHKGDIFVQFKGKMGLESNAQNLWAQGGGVQISLKGEAHNIPVDNLSTLWPVGLAANARDWVTKNITVGMATRATINMTGRYILAEAKEEGVEPDLSQRIPRSPRFNLTHLSGDIDAQNITVQYLDDLPFVTEASGACQYTQDNFTIQAIGKVNGLTLESGYINIADFDKMDETIDIRLELVGPVERSLEIIAKEPLALPQKLGFNSSIFRGSSHTFVHLIFPLKKNLPLEQVQVNSHSKIMDGKIISGESLEGSTNPMENGQFDLQVDNDHLALVGSATCLSLLTQVRWIERFHPTHEQNQSEWHLTGIGGSPSMGSMDLDYLVKQNKSGTLSVSADLRDFVFQLPYFSMDKKQGDPLQLKIQTIFDKKNLHRIKSASLEGEGISIQSSGSLNLGDSQGSFKKISDFETISLDGLEFTLTQLGTLSGVLKVMGTYTKPHLKGKIKLIDMSPFFQQDNSSDFDLKKDVILDFMVEKVKMSKDLSFDNVSFYLNWQGNLLHSAHIQSQDAGKLELLLTPPKVSFGTTQGNSGQKFSLQSNNAGDLLDCFLPQNDLEGGVINVVGNRTMIGAETIWDAEMDVREVVVKKAPFLAQLLSATSFQGLLDTLSGSGIHFDRCTGRFTWADKDILFQDFHLAGGAIGLDIEGTLSLESDEMDLVGEIYPLHGLNHFMARIPLIGGALSGGSSKGIFSTAFEAKGNKDNPRIMVNPLTTFAPGAVRKVMKEVTQS